MEVAKEAGLTAEAEEASSKNQTENHKHHFELTNDEHTHHTRAYCVYCRAPVDPLISTLDRPNCRCEICQNEIDVGSNVLRLDKMDVIMGPRAGYLHYECFLADVDTSKYNPAKKDTVFTCPRCGEPTAKTNTAICQECAMVPQSQREHELWWEIRKIKHILEGLMNEPKTRGE